MPAGFVGIYSPEQRRHRIERFEQVNDDIGSIESKSLRYFYLFIYLIQKRKNRVWTKKVKYDVRKNFADSRLRVKVSDDTFILALLIEVK